MAKAENKDLDYWKANAEEDYIKVPISVLRYITELEKVVKNCSIPDVVGQSGQCSQCRELLDGEVAISSKALTNPNWEE